LQKIEVIALRCEDFTANTTELMEGALGWRKRLEMRLHLMVCDACTAFLQQMRRAVRLMAALPPAALPAETEAVVIASLPQNRQDAP
jgi:hypothetical protein